MAPVTPDPKKIRAFASAAAFDAWLAAHHAKADELWLKIHKKASGLPSVTASEAIDVALCWGWIDGIRKSFDAASFLQRFTPRTKQSRWSQINRDRVAQLIAAGRMRGPGLREVEAARADGRWDRAYASPSAMTLPEDLLRAIARVPAAAAALEGLSRQNQFAFAYRLHHLKTAAARARNIEKFVAMLARGETIYPNDAPSKTAQLETTAAGAGAKRKPRGATRRAGAGAKRSKAPARPRKSEAAGAARERGSR